MTSLQAGARQPARRAPQPASRITTVLMSTDAVGGVWRYTVDLGRALAARGVRSTVAVMGPAPSAAQRREALHAGLHVLDRPYRLEWMDDPWVDVERAGAWLLSIAGTLQPDIIHLNGYAHARLPWPAPVVTVAHSCVRTWWRAVEREEAPSRLSRYTREVAAGLTAASMVVAPSAAMLSALEREYCVQFRSRVIPNGSTATPGTPVPRKEPLILSAGRVWDAAKNIALVARIADRVTWPVYVAGDCQHPDGQPAVLPGVHALGRLSMSEMTAWYRQAAIYVLPARYEPFGLSVLEAASAGCALVLGDIPTLRENWDGAAMFVPPDDRDGLAGAVQQLIDDPATRAELSARAVDRASRFSIDRTADAYLGVYESLLS